MAALVSLAFEEGAPVGTIPTYAVIADEAGFEYVELPDPAADGEAPDNSFEEQMGRRAKFLQAEHGEGLSTPMQWLGLAMRNVSYTQFVGPTPVADRAAGVTLANRLLAAFGDDADEEDQNAEGQP